jgi:YfiH family protein
MPAATAPPPLDPLPLLGSLPGAVARVTTRHGGVSIGPYATLNLGGGVGDDPEAVRRNWELLAEAASLPLDHFIRMQQVHGASAAIVQRPGQGSIPDVDALVTDRPGLALCVLAADCVPVVAVDPVVRVAGAAHAGWRGTAAGVVPSLLAAMERLGASPGRVWMAMGPCIGADDYEVGPEVADAMRVAVPGAAAALRPGRGDRWLLDLATANRLQAVAFGVEEARIARPSASTFRDPDRYSHRRDGPATGRFCTFIRLA